MDIEYSEWRAIPAMVSSGAMKNIRQLYVEYHNGVRGASASFVNAMVSLRMLYQQGFRMFWSHVNEIGGNPGVSSINKREIGACYEIYYLNINNKDR